MYNTIGIPLTGYNYSSTDTAQYPWLPPVYGQTLASHDHAWGIQHASSDATG